MTNRPRALFFDGHEIPPSDIWAVLQHGGAGFKRIQSNMGEIYVQINPRDSEDDFWVLASEVDAWRDWHPDQVKKRVNK